MSSISDQFLADAEAPQLPPDAEMHKLQELAQQQLDLEQAVLDLENQLSEKKKQLAHVQEVALPSLLQQFGISRIDIEGGRLTVKQEYYATIKEEHRGAAFSWLESKGHADLIKHEVVMSFTRGQDDEARQAMEVLADNNFVYRDEKKVHAQTLKAFVKEQIEAGNELPLETFSVHVKQVSKIQRVDK
jgi:hypothetical protein